MNGEQLRDEYIDALLDRVTGVRYPSHQIMDRVERILFPFPGR